MNLKYKDFLTQELPAQLKTLTGNQEPNFGLMTAHHMVEHLVFVTKSAVKRRGEPSQELSKSQMFFRKFLDNGAIFQYKPKEGISKADLQDLRTGNMDEAIALLKEANDKFYQLYDSNPDHKSYNDMMGEFNMDDLELFYYQHGRWHLHQFGIIKEFTKANPI